MEAAPAASAIEGRSAKSLRCSHVHPVMQEDFLEILRCIGIVDDDAGIAILPGAEGGPVLTADYHDIGIDDHALVVHVRLNAQVLYGIHSSILQPLDPHVVLPLAGDQPDVDAGIDQVCYRADQLQM